MLFSVIEVQPNTIHPSINPSAVCLSECNDLEVGGTYKLLCIVTSTAWLFSVFVVWQQKHPKEVAVTATYVDISLIKRTVIDSWKVWEFEEVKLLCDKGNDSLIKDSSTNNPLGGCFLTLQLQSSWVRKTSQILQMSFCVCVCVCACARARALRRKVSHACLDKKTGGFTFGSSPATF